MMDELYRKRIIFIHGLNSKPPKEDIHKLCTRCLMENIKLEYPELERALRDHPHIFRSAYWANETPHHIEDDQRYVKKLEVQVEKVIEERKKRREEFHVGTGERVSAFFKDRGSDLVKLMAGALTVKDDVMRMFLRETELYDQDQHIADRIRWPLEEELRDAWDNNCEVTIISHSMGTFITYDVLWRFSHRNVEGFFPYRNKNLKLFITMGSPLGDRTVQNLLFARYHRNKGKRQYPTNIENWHNYACLGDVVSHYHDFQNDFFDPMKAVGLFKDASRNCFKNYDNLHNPFEVVEHKHNRKSIKRSPHSLYGYLVQPKVAKWTSRFLLGKL